MSATLDALKFQKYFGRGAAAVSGPNAGETVAPLFKGPSRMHPVEIFYTEAPEPATPKRPSQTTSKPASAPSS